MKRKSVLVCPLSASSTCLWISSQVYWVAQFKMRKHIYNEHHHYDYSWSRRGCELALFHLLSVRKLGLQYIKCFFYQTIIKTDSLMQCYVKVFLLKVNVKLNQHLYDTLTLYWGETGAAQCRPRWLWLTQRSSNTLQCVRFLLWHNDDGCSRTILRRCGGVVAQNYCLVKPGIKGWQHTHA